MTLYATAQRGKTVWKVYTGLNGLAHIQRYKSGVLDRAWNSPNRTPDAWLGLNQNVRWETT